MLKVMIVEDDNFFLETFNLFIPSQRKIMFLSERFSKIGC
jgi:hypothetical protein